jgi:isopentenyldiphosphate isomerase
LPDYPPLTIYNEQDEPVGEAYFKEMVEKGLLHRVVLIIIKDKEGRILMQKRGPYVSTNPNRWDFSAAGYVNKDEDYLAAAERELKEEIGLINIQLKEIAYFRRNAIVDGLQLNRFIKAYEATIEHVTDLQLDPEEVSKVCWYDHEELKKRLAEKPDEFNNELAEILQKLGY